mgnify:CR=1 FL=1
MAVDPRPVIYATLKPAAAPSSNVTMNDGAAGNNGWHHDQRYVLCQCHELRGIQGASATESDNKLHVVWRQACQLALVSRVEPFGVNNTRRRF